MNKYISVKEVVTYLPSKVREDFEEADLITMIIRAYRELGIPQDKNYVEEYIYTDSDSTNVTIPDSWQNIKSIEVADTLSHTEEVIYYPVYYTGLDSNYCVSCRKCEDCMLKFSIVENILRLPFADAQYRVIYNQLYSDEMKIYDDPQVIRYLESWVLFRTTHLKSRKGSQASNLLTFEYGMMNTLYRKARANAIFASIKLRNHKLNLLPINMTIDEFSNRLYTHKPARQ